MRQEILHFVQNDFVFSDLQSENLYRRILNPLKQTTFGLQIRKNQGGISILLRQEILNEVKNDSRDANLTSRCQNETTTK